MSGEIREAADRLGTDAEPAAVAAEVKEWEAALFRITSQLDLDAAGIEAGDSGSERLLALRQAVESGHLRVAGDAEDDQRSGADQHGESTTDESVADDRGEVTAEQTTSEGSVGNRQTAGDRTTDRHTADEHDDEPDAARAAARVAEARAPSERITQQLLGTLQNGSVPGIESALERTADAVETAAALDGVDTDLQTARATLRETRAALSSLPEPVATVVDDRLSELDQQLQTVVDGDPLVPYAVRREAAFYRDELTETLAEADNRTETRDDNDTATTAPGGGAPENGDDTGNGRTEPGVAAGDPSGDTDGGVDAAIERVADRRREITERFVNRREDHSHAIPLLFLSTVDDLRETAHETATDGEPERVKGLATAALAVLDTVESLYEENQYSVMLRQLRG